MSMTVSDHTTATGPFCIVPESVQVEWGTQLRKLSLESDPLSAALNNLHSVPAAKNSREPAWNPFGPFETDVDVRGSVPAAAELIEKLQVMFPKLPIPYLEEVSQDMLGHGRQEDTRR